MRSSTSSSELRRWLRTVTAFLAVQALALGGLEAFARARFRPAEARPYRAVTAGPVPSTLVMGPSTAMYGVDASFLDRPGRPAVNGAMYGSGPRYWKTWYELMVRPRFRPHTVLLDLPPFWNRIVLWRVVEQDAMLLPTDAFIALLRRPETAVRSALINATVVGARRRELLPLLLGRIDQEAVPGHLDPPDAKLPNLAPMPDHRVDPAARGHLEALLDELAADGVRVALFQSPLYQPEPPAPGTNAWLRDLARRRGLPCFDYNETRRSAFNADGRAFADVVHMRPAGAKRFSARFAADLEDAGLIDRQPR